MKSKLKMKSGIKKKFENESNGANKKDLRILNYYDLKDGEKMKILLVPSAESGDLYTKWKSHGPNLHLNGLKPIRSADEATGQNCPIMQYGYSILNEGREDGNDYEAFKEEAKKWFPRDYTLAQCIVLETPVEINEAEDGNIVKLFYMPYAIEEKIREAVLEGIVDEEDLCMHPIIIKNTKNGKYNGYKNSYISPKQVDDDTLDALEDFNIDPFELSEVDLVPPVPTYEEAEKWLEDAIKKYNKESGEDDGSDQSAAPEPPKKTSGGVQDAIKNRKSSSAKEDSDHDNDDNDDVSEDDDSKTQSSQQQSSGANALRDRLMKARS